jgi:hypothetical protein
MLALRITSDQGVERVDLPENGGDAKRLAAMQACVGGFIELVHTPTVTVSVFVNEEGKFTFGDDPPNRLGQAVFQALGGRLFPNDWIAGPVLVCGFRDRDGETVGLDEGLAQHIEGIGQALTRGDA